MSKELEILEEIQNELYGQYDFKDISEYSKERFNIIKQALKELEQLRKLKLLPYPKENDEEYRQGVIKKLMALEIIIDKDITPSWFIRNLKKGMSYEDYHFSNSGSPYDMAKEQFDLVKEVLS